MAKGIMYVGKKPKRPDTVANTGLVWVPGQVHIVTDSVADALLKHPDIWAEKPIEQVIEDAGKATPKKAEVTDSKPLPKSKPEEDIQPTPNLRDMNLAELRKHAKSVGIALPARITEATARRKLHDEHRARNLRGRGG